MVLLYIMFIVNFADDSTVVTKAKTLLEASITANLNLDKIYNWLCANRLKLNIDKTKFSIFTKKKVTWNPIIKINNCIIEQTHCSKLLGIFVDNKLNFSNHIKKVCSKLAYCGHILNKVDKSVNTKIKKQMYYAFAAPLIEYGISVYASTSYKQLHPLQVIQNMLIRSLSNKILPTNMLFKKLGILNIKQLFSMKLACYMFRAKHGNCPETIINKIYTESQHSYRTRHKNLSKKPKFTKTISTKCLSWQAPSAWNELTTDIKNCNNYKKFKIMVKQYLLNSS